MKDDVMKAVLEGIMKSPEVKKKIDKGEEVKIEIVGITPKKEDKDDKKEDKSDDVCEICGQPMSEHNDDGSYSGMMPMPLIQLLKAKRKKGSK